MRWIELALSYNGLLALCLAMPKHYRQVFARAPGDTPVRLFRLGGWLSLSISLAASVATNGWSFGPVEWIGMMAFTGLVLVFTLPYVPRLVAWLGLGVLVAAPVVLLLSA
jgi:Protein of unknown function (DUF3325)